MLIGVDTVRLKLLDNPLMVSHSKIDGTAKKL